MADDKTIKSGNETPKSKTEVPAPPQKTTRLGLIVGLIAVVVMAGLIYVMQKQNRATAPGSAVSASKQTAVASIGGPFTLTDHNGRKVTEQDFRGKFLLVMFGYTYCPDICPTMLSTMSDAMDLLGIEAGRVTPIFITIDPERDTAEHLKEYVTYFHPSLMALTGTAAEIKSVAKAYRVYYAKATENKDDAEDYLMDHSSISYLMGPDGKFIAHFSHGTEAGAIAQRINENL